MLRQIGLFFILCIASFGCTKKTSQDTARFHDDGRAKPVVALVPIFDRTGSQIAWSLSDEFTDHLQQRFYKSRNFLVTPLEQVYAAIEFLNEQNNPFSNDYAWIKNTFSGPEFVVFAELVEHDIHPKHAKNNFVSKLTPSSELSMTMRVRVFDLRGESPRVILQELIHQDHLIPKQRDLSQESKDRWKRVSFHLSPLGLAHAQFVKELSKRVEDYILLSKSR